MGRVWTFHFAGSPMASLRGDGPLGQPDQLGGEFSLIAIIQQLTRSENVQKDFSLCASRIAACAAILTPEE
jgi:hypothetical protein